MSNNVASIRINSGIKKIEVNDNGDCIFLRLSDLDYINNVLNFFELINEKSTILRDKLNGANVTGKDDMDSVLSDETLTDEQKVAEVFNHYNVEKVEVFDAVRSVHSELAVEFDRVFGVDACAKVFGLGEDNNPVLDMYLEFMEAITPFFEEYMKERNKNAIKKVAPKKGRK